MKEFQMSAPLKPYMKPELAAVGSVAELTQRLGSGFEEQPQD